MDGSQRRRGWRLYGGSDRRKPPFGRRRGKLLVGLDRGQAVRGAVQQHGVHRGGQQSLCVTLPQRVDPVWMGAGGHFDRVGGSCTASCCRERIQSATGSDAAESHGIVKCVGDDEPRRRRGSRNREGHIVLIGIDFLSAGVFFVLQLLSALTFVDKHDVEQGRRGGALFGGQGGE